MKKPNHAGSGQIRIIGGQWRGRKLPVPESPGLRPTTDRVRETLFNWLAPSMVDAHCLDCFAGSGALGLEALSRYAASTTLLEMERSVAQQLQKNLATLKANNGKVVNTNTLAFLSQPGTPHHIVFVDPPFRKGLLEETLSLLEKNHWLADVCRERSRKRTTAGSGKLAAVSRKSRRTGRLPPVSTRGTRRKPC